MIGKEKKGGHSPPGKEEEKRKEIYSFRGSKVPLILGDTGDHEKR